MRLKKCVFTAALLFMCTIAPKAQSVEAELFTLDAAVNNAIKYNSELELIRKEIYAQQAAKHQSGLYPNPELEVESENIFGEKDFRGFRGSESTVKVNQNILLAGKIKNRVKIAELDITLSEWDYEIKLLEISTQIKVSFGKALAAQKLMEKNDELIKLSEELITNLKNLIKVGKISPVEVSRANIVLNSLQIKLISLQADYAVSITELKSLINNPSLSFQSLSGDLDYVSVLPSYDSLLIYLDNNPNLKRYNKEYEKLNAVIDYEKSLSVPDLTISAGYKRLNELNTNTFLIGASIPLPLFNNNQGSIQESKIRFDQKHVEYELVKSRLASRLKQSYIKYNSFLNTLEQLRDVSIPFSEETFRIIKNGNISGKYSVLDVLDSQRTLFELQNQYVNTIAEIHGVKSEIEGIIADKIK